MIRIARVMPFCNSNYMLFAIWLMVHSFSIFCEINSSLLFLATAHIE